MSKYNSPVKRLYIFTVEHKIIIVQILALFPADTVPERVPDIIFCKCDQAHFVDLLRFERVHAEDDHRLADAAPAVFRVHAHMVQTAAPAVMPAQDRAHNLPILDRDHARRRVPPQKTRDTFPRIVNAPDGKSFDRHPQRTHLVIVLNRHQSHHIEMPSSPKRPPTIIIYYRKKYNYFHQNIQKSCNSSDFGFLLAQSLFHFKIDLMVNIFQPVTT